MAFCTDFICISENIVLMVAAWHGMVVTENKIDKIVIEKMLGF